MAQLVATRKNFEHAFKKHYECYKTFPQDAHKRSKRLLLVYAVENGLKCLLLKKICKQDSDDLRRHSGCRKCMGDDGHDIKEMLKWLGTGGQFHIKNFKVGSVDVQNVEPHLLHQFWRYGLETEDISAEEDVEQTLFQIVDWVCRSLDLR